MIKLLWNTYRNFLSFSLFFFAKLSSTTFQKREGGSEGGREWVSEWVREWVSEWVSEWVLFSANSEHFQLYHGENKLVINEMMMRSTFF
jgi:hypothetical protein